MRGTTGLTLSRWPKFTTLEVKEHQPTVACSVRRRGSMAFCSGSSQPGTRLILHALQPAPSAGSPLCLAHSHAARLLCSRPWPYCGHQLQCLRAPALQPATDAGCLLAAGRLAARPGLLAPTIRDACRRLTTRPTVAPSSRRLPTLAARRAEMNALVDWLSSSRTPAQIRHCKRRRSA